MAGSLHSRSTEENSLPPPIDSMKAPPDADTMRLVRLDGLAVRRRRHDHGWSPRDLVDAIADACFTASGLRKTLSPNQIQAIEEREERVTYGELLLLADGLGCDPSDLIAEGEMSNRRRGSSLH